MRFPLWATPPRRAYLVEVALTNLQDYEIDFFTGNLLNPAIEELIDYWKGDDRGERSFLWELEKRRLHALRPRITKRGQFDSIRREQYLAERPIFQIVAIGVNAFTQRRVAQVHTRRALRRRDHGGDAVFGLRLDLPLVGFPLREDCSGK